MNEQGKITKVNHPLKIKPTIPLEMGWIPYWNLRPLESEIKRIAGKDIHFNRGAPSLVNKMLSEGKVSLAPCSSVCLVQNPKQQLAFPLGVASTGKVKSVYIGFHHGDGPLFEAISHRHKKLSKFAQKVLKELPNNPRKVAECLEKYAADLPSIDVEMPEIIMTPASAASVALTRILFKLWFGVPPKEIKPVPDHSVSSDEQPVELLIGDEALIRRRSFSRVIDLGEAWHSLTGLPFVYAVWQSTGRTLSPHWEHLIRRAAEKAQAKMHVDPSFYLPDVPPADVIGHQVDLGAYWKCIQYTLGPSHLQGLSLFLSLVRQMNPKAQSDAAFTQILRCQELAQQPVN